MSSAGTNGREYRLSRPPAAPAAPELDPYQRAVVDHRGGPLLVLAGPGTGKTTTLVELVAARVADGLAPDDVQVLTFSRKAAEEIRARIARRIGGGAVVSAMTFHSYCYALVRSSLDPDQFADPLHLLSAPEQEWRLAEILGGALAEGRLQWPEHLEPALRTRGIVREIADLLGTARSHGLDPAQLLALADDRREPAWAAVARLWAEYDDVLALANETDYAGLVDAALAVLDTTDDVASIQPRLLVVDEFQDTDAAQVQLLQRLVGPHTDLVAVGDPDQSIYAFRGADVRGVWEFPSTFGSADRPARTLPLRRSRRSGARLLEVSREVVAPLGVSGAMSADEFAAFRSPEPTDRPSRVEAPTFTDTRSEAEHVALLLTRAHLDDGVAWDQMAVLVRGVAALGPIERALREADVPVEVAGDEIPLARQPAVQALTQAAGCAQALAEGRALLPEQAETLLLGPVGRLDPSQLRALSRVLRRHHHEVHGELVDSRDLLAAALADPVLLFDVEVQGHLPGTVPRLRRLAVLLQAASRHVLEHAAAEQVLWTLWDGTSWPRRLREAAEAGDDESHRDLDALVALFDDAARVEHTEIGTYLEGLEAQQIPSDSLAERGIRGSAVRLMTAHRSKGLEWDLVVVAGVQDGVWPATRAQHSLLRRERLDPRGDGGPPSFGALVAEERRLFYVAVTRPRDRLVVTAVQSPAADGDQPSRFHEQVRELADPSVGSDAPQPRPRRGATLRGVTVELRQLAETGSTPAVRAEAATRLAALAEAGVGAAAPRRWWGLVAPTASDQPIRPVDAPLALSGTAVEGLSGCSLRWFLSREARGDRGTSTAQGFGLAIHVLAAELVDDPSLDADTLVTHLDAVWHHLDHDTPWIADRERAEAHAAVHRLVRWHRASAAERTTVGAEQDFEVEIPVGDDVVRLRGQMDRVEVDTDGRVHVVDFKTGKSKPSVADLQVHPQMGVYQVAVEHGAFAEAAPDARRSGGAVPDARRSGGAVPDARRSGGAELVHLRQELASGPGLPVVQVQAPPVEGEPFFATELIARSAATLRAEQFAATTNRYCQMCSFRLSCPAQDGHPTVARPEPDGAS